MTSLALCVLLASAADERVVVLVPFGPVAATFVDAAKVAIEARANVTVRVDPMRELPQSAYYEPRKRWRAEKLLDAITADPPPGAWKVVALTSAEISTTKGSIFDWGIAGLGNIGDLACVASTFLYTKHSATRAKAAERYADVVVHEFGHTLGMPHCEVAGCVMADAKGKAMKSADQSRGQYCSRCRALAPAGVLK